MRVPTFGPTLEDFCVAGRTNHQLLGNLASSERDGVNDLSVWPSFNHFLLDFNEQDTHGPTSNLEIFCYTVVDWSMSTAPTATSVNLLCVHCAVREATTADHIPPKGLYAPPRPSDLLTVPSCEECNGGASMDDEYMRTFLTLKERAGDHPDAKTQVNATMRSLRRNRITGFGRAFLKTVKPVNVTTPAGLILRKALSYEVSFERLEPVVVRIVKGLYWHHEHARIGPEYNVGALFEDGLHDLDSETRQQLNETIVRPLLQSSLRSTPRNVLRYRYVVARGDEPISAWLFEFYGDVQCLALVTPQSADGKDVSFIRLDR